jgi:hypothetical protein
MGRKRLVSSVVLLGVLATTSAFAADGQRRRAQGREGSNDGSQRQEQGQVVGRAVPRSQAAPPPRVQDQRQQYRASGQERGGWSNNDRYDNHGNNGRNYYRPSYPSYAYVPAYPAYGAYGYRGYGSNTVIVPRYITPRIVTVVPYRPYVYRPRLGMGVYYGSNGYPYGYTPRGYYDPQPGYSYGGLRITGAPQVAQVFADGYYVGIVNDFDGIFQHLNLEAGPHQIEIRDPNLPPVAFDVIIQPGQTITYRADVY